MPRHLTPRSPSWSKGAISCGSSWRTAGAALTEAQRRESWRANITLGLPLKHPIESTEYLRASCAPAQVGSRVTALKKTPGGHRILLADDHALVRQGLRAISDGFPDMTVVGEAGNGVEAVKMAGELLPDVVLMDINMPGMDGVQATQQIKAAQPAIVVIGLSVNQSTQTIQAMMEAGASDFLSKDAAPELLHQMLMTSPLSSTGACV